MRKAGKWRMNGGDGNRERRVTEGDRGIRRVCRERRGRRGG